MWLYLKHVVYVIISQTGSLCAYISNISLCDYISNIKFVWLYLKHVVYVIISQTWGLCDYISNKEETSQYPHLCLINYAVEKFGNFWEEDILIASQLFEIKNAGLFADNSGVN